MKLENIKFNNGAGSKIFSFEDLISTTVFYIKEMPEAKYHIVIGTDSKSQQDVKFVTAVGVHRIGNGGRYFWTRSPVEKCMNLRDRIYNEAIKSITLAQELKSALKDKLGEEFFWDNKITVHIDVGEKGETKKIKDAVVGMVKGFGLEAAIKPDAYGAFALADRHT